ncbi:choline kinase cytoplasm [Pisolithus thermaeus]|nr:choline kinase cytoplasm [Pisolithus thermaeus]
MLPGGSLGKSNRDARSSRTSPLNPLSASSSTPAVDILNGLRVAHVKLDSRSYKSQAFATRLLSIVVALQVPGWCTAPDLTPTLLSVHKVSGSLTNSVYFVSCPSSRCVPTLLLRIYGFSTDSLISRSRELNILHILSSQYNIGPTIYGTFTNGRVEEYFDSITLTPCDLREKTISRWIGARMAELHSVKISAVEGPLAISSQEGKSWEIGVKRNIKAWLPLAAEVLAHPNMQEEDTAVLDLDAFRQKWSRYMRWISHIEKVEGCSRRVFAHNDAQCGNLLRLTRGLPQGTPEHHQIVVVDFEYAAPNPLAFDIVNHFHEWTADYHSSSPHVLHPSRYPTPEERHNFYEAYLSRVNSSNSPSCGVVSEANLAQLERQVRIWSPASHAVWAVWGIVQAKDNLERGIGEGEFDYIGYAKCRMEAFFRELDELGVQ